MFDHKKQYKIDLENHPSCPECKSTNTRSKYVSCICCRTYEGNGRTCWEAPYCNECGHLGWGNSDGGLWYDPDDRKGWRDK